MSKDYDKHMLRERAERAPDITDEMWSQVSEHNRMIVDEFFESSSHLSKTSISQYKSALRIFFWWVHVKLKDKPMYNIKKRDFLKYVSHLKDKGFSSSGLKLKKSAVSSLCNFIENVLSDDEEFKEYEKFRNFCRGLPAQSSNVVYEKIPMTREEYDKVMEYLKEKEDYLGMAFHATSFNVGGRRNEIRNLKSEIATYENEKDSEGNELPFVLSHIVYGKGRDGGKPLKFMINNEAMEYIRLWLEQRRYENEYIFTVKYAGNNSQIGLSWANNFCQNIVSIVLDRRFTMHNYKASAITHLLEQGVDMKAVSKYVAHHENSATTEKFYDLRSDEEEKNSIFK